MGDVFLVLGNIARGVSADEVMLNAVEARWNAMEQPLFVLGCASHPFQARLLRRLIGNLAPTSTFSAAKIALMAHLYFEKLIEPDRHKSIVSEIFQWLIMDDEEAGNLPTFENDLLFGNFTLFSIRNGAFWQD